MRYELNDYKDQLEQGESATDLDGHHIFAKLVRQPSVVKYMEN